MATNRLLQTLRVSELAVKVYRNVEYACYVVRLYECGLENESVRYETDSKEDAFATAVVLFRIAWAARDEVGAAIAEFQGEQS
jgi:hypothetical protein